MSNLISGMQIGADKTITFANSALINTQVNVDIVIDITKMSAAKERVALEAYNPSTATDLTVKIMAKALAFGGDTRYCLIDTVTIPKSQAITGTTVNAYLKIFEGLFVGEDLRLVVSNNTALGAAEGFSAYARMRVI